MRWMVYLVLGLVVMLLLPTNFISTQVPTITKAPQQPGELWNYTCGNTINDVAVSGDGKYVAVASQDGNLYFFKQDGTLLWMKNFGSDPPKSVDITEYGTYIFVANGSMVHLYNNMGNDLGSFDTTGYIGMVDITPDGKYAVSFGYFGDYIDFFNLTGGSMPSLYQWYTYNYGDMGQITADGSYVMSTDGSKVYLFDGKNYNPISPVTSPNTPDWSFSDPANGGIECADISPDGAYIAVGTDSDHVYLLDNSGTIIWNYATQSYVDSVSLSYDDQYLTAVSEGLYLFSTSSSTPQWTNSSLWNSAFFPKKADIIMISWEGAIDINGNLILVSNYMPSSQNSVSEDGIYFAYPDDHTVRFIGKPYTPQPPTNLQAKTGEGYINITWSPPADDGGSPILGYRVYRCWGEGNAYSMGNIIANVSNSYYNDTSVNNGDYYSYAVVAVNSVGDSYPSENISARAGSIPLPPENLTYEIGGNSKNRTIYLSWSPPSDNGGLEITEYRIYRGTVSNQEKLIDSCDGWNTNYADSVGVNETYYYYVTAVNDIGESNPSDEINVPKASVPSAPTNLTIECEWDEIWLDWSPPSNNGNASILYYNIYRGTESGKETFLDTVGNYSCSYTDFVYAPSSNLEPNITYYYYVTAVNAVGESKPSNEVSGGIPYIFITPASGVESISEHLSISSFNETYQVNYEAKAGSKIKIEIKAVEGKNPLSNVSISPIVVGVYDPEANTYSYKVGGKFSPSSGKTDNNGVFVTYFYAPNFTKKMYIFISVDTGGDINIQNLVIKITPLKKTSGETNPSGIGGLPPWLLITTIIIIAVIISVIGFLLKKRKRKNEKENSEEQTAPVEKAQNETMETSDEASTDWR